MHNRSITRNLSVAMSLLVAGPATVPVTTAAAAPVVAPATAGGERGSASVHGWTVRLDRRALSPRGQRVHRRHGFQTVGVTWSGRGDPHVQVRSRSHGSWSPWRDADRITRGTDGATEPLWVGPSQSVRVRVDAWRDDLAVVLVDPGEAPRHDSASTGAANRAPALVTPQTTPVRRVAVRERKKAPIPRLRLRRDWGADEKLRDGDPVYLDRIKQAHVHHTAGANDYTRSEVPGIIRAMYWYHTQKLGWSDIGYNFLVDRFGRIWVGRAGGYRKRVRGAHTLGFNHASFGVASIGNHETASANEKVKGALVRLIAWKFDLEGRNPGRSVTMYSQGSDLYPKGTKVRLPAVDGHRDTNQTACPGIRMYDVLPQIRRRAQTRVDNWS